MVDGFILTFSFEDDFPNIHFVLQIVKKNMFENVTPMTWKEPDSVVHIENALECYKLTIDE